MVRTELMPKQRKESGLARHAGALALSCAFHASLLGLLLGVLIYQEKWMPPPSGSQANTPLIMLSTLMITAPPQSPKIEKPIVATRPANVVEATPQPQPAPVEEGVPVLAVKQPKTAPAHPMHAIPPPVAKVFPVRPKSTASFASSYAPGENVMAHPPYPDEAQNLGETGTVVVTVTFNTAGDVTQAEVTQSSGVPLLDTNTRSFILTHWHSTAFAGQTVMQPVRYTGE